MITQTELQQKSKEELVKLVASQQDLEAKIETQQQTIENKTKHIQLLSEYIRILKHHRYCSRSEQFIDDTPQGRLFDEADLARVEEEVIEEGDASIHVPGHTRKKGRKPLPKELPREQRVYDLDDSEKICACGCALTQIGDVRSEQLDIIPAQIKVIEHIQNKYACKSCEQTIKTAQKPKQPIAKSIASPGLLAQTLTSKFQYHLPLYRQEQMLHALGVDIPRATLSHWVIKSSQLLQPLVNLQQDKILSYDVAYADESTVQVLKEANKEAQSKSYMWVFGGGPPEAFSICYQYHPSRAHAIATEFFEGYSGYLHSDGYQAYDSLAKLNTTVTLVGCWYHLRRKFSEAAKVSKKSGLSEWFLKQIQRLSKAEKFAVTSKLSYEQIVQLRQEKAKPIIDKIKLKLDEQLSKVPEQSLLGKAIAYGLNQWPKLLSYLKDGRLEISNNRMERAIKPFATGRKNWLFANSVAGAKAAAIIFSLVETCKFHEVDVYHWFRHALENLPNCETVEDFEALLPFNCKHITLGK